MRRFLYRALIALHPPRFRERFGDEMLCVFDEAGPERTARLFADGVLSLARQWLLRSNLWKMAAGATISSLLLFAWGNAMAYGVDVSLMRGARWHERLAVNPWLGGPETPFQRGRIRARRCGRGGHPRWDPQDGSAKAARATARRSARRTESFRQHTRKQGLIWRPRSKLADSGNATRQRQP